MANVYKSLCRELDYLLVDIIADMEKVVASKVLLEKSMDDGYVNIAKTRYINGSSSVTTMQLPTESSNPIEPHVLVHRSSDKHGASIEIVNTLSHEESSVLLEGLRNRQNKPEKTEEEKSKNSDPIRLFGVLVPQSLKMAQKSFIKSTDQVGAVAEAQTDFGEKLIRYKRLADMKSRIFVIESGA